MMKKILKVLFVIIVLYVLYKALVWLLKKLFDWFLI